SREHLRAFVSDGNRVLKMRARLPVHRYYSPAVAQNFRKVCPLVNHWFHGKNVTCLYLGSETRLAVVGDLGVLMHSPTDSVTDVISDNRVTVILSVLLHRPADVAEMIARSTLLNCQLKTFFSDPNKLQGFFINFSDRHCCRGVSYEPSQSHAAIDRKNVSL